MRDTRGNHILYNNQTITDSKRTVIEAVKTSAEQATANKLRLTFRRLIWVFAGTVALFGSWWMIAWFLYTTGVVVSESDVPFLPELNRLVAIVTTVGVLTVVVLLFLLLHRVIKWAEVRSPIVAAVWPVFVVVTKGIAVFVITFLMLLGAYSIKNASPDKNKGGEK